MTNEKELINERIIHTNTIAGFRFDCINLRQYIVITYEKRKTISVLVSIQFESTKRFKKNIHVNDDMKLLYSRYFHFSLIKTYSKSI